MIEFLRALPRPRHLCEGTHAAWLYEILSPHVDEIVVAGVARSRGPKSDQRDAFALADTLCVGTIETRVYKGLGEFKKLRELSRAYRSRQRLGAVLVIRVDPLTGEASEFTALEPWCPATAYTGRGYYAVSWDEDVFEVDLATGTVTVVGSFSGIGSVGGASAVLP